MPRSYRHIKEYESEVLKLKEQGHTQREIAEKFGFSKEQIKGLLKRKRKRDKKQSYGIFPKKRGRPSKDCVVSDQDKVAELKYILARKDAKIKRLEMENELMRDFLSFTERK